MKKTLSILLAVVLLLSLSVNALAAEMTPTANKNTLSAGEEVVVTISLNEDIKDIVTMNYKLYFDNSVFALTKTEQVNPSINVAAREDTDKDGTFYNISCMDVLSEGITIARGDLCRLTFRAKTNLTENKESSFRLVFDNAMDNKFNDKIVHTAGEAAKVSVSPAGEVLTLYGRIYGKSVNSAFADLTGSAGSNGVEYVCKDIEKKTGLDVIKGVLEASGYTYVATETAITSITDPSGVTLANGDAAYGPKSVWVATINGEKPATTLAGYVVDNESTGFDGDEFVWFDTWAVELKEVAIPEGITYIPFALFGSCYNLERVTLPSTLKTIDVGAFQYCGSLQRIAIPAKVSAIDSTAFSGCTGLMQIEVDPANRTYCSDADGALYTKDKATLVAFPGGRSGSYTVAAATRTIAHDAFSNSALSSITLPDRLSTIEYSAFKYCSALAGLIIPAGVTELQTPICFGCEKLSGIWVDVANKHYANDAVGVLYSKDFSVLLECPDGLTGKYTVRDGTSRIDFGAFDGSALTEVALPDSVAVIDGLAFYGCTGLNEIVIPSGVKEIGDRAFYACENLKAVYFLGNAPETVGECAFQISYYDDSTDTSSDINIPGLNDSTKDGDVDGSDS